MSFPRSYDFDRNHDIRLHMNEDVISHGIEHTSTSRQRVAQSIDGFDKLKRGPVSPSPGLHGPRAHESSVNSYTSFSMHFQAMNCSTRCGFGLVEDIHDLKG